MDDVQRYRDQVIDTVEAIVVGAGVVGLACARALAQQGKEVIILEAQDSFGSETSSRNSEVIHAGIYYPKNSNKANLCVAGKKLLYKYCDNKNIPYKRIGKIIVASSKDEVAKLGDIQASAAANGVDDLQPLSKEQVLELEPELSAEAGLFSPSTGIIDSHNLMLSLLGDAEAAGAMLALNSRVISGSINGRYVQLHVESQGVTMELQTNMLINAAGLHASTVAGSIDGINHTEIYKTSYRKGSYFTYAGSSPFKHLIYPVPVTGGLGIHSTVDLAGQLRFGPDVELIPEINYTVDPSKTSAFAQAIQRYWPKVQEDLLQPGYAGVRPALINQNDKAGDFEIITHCLSSPSPLVISLFGIESPGLTACLAIADNVVSRV